MKKTVSINLGGMAFNIEEDAYSILRKYLDEIKDHFSHEEGGEEIVTDIEARIAELVKTRLGEWKQVITPADVNEVISVMGKPHEMSEGGKSDTKEGNSKNAKGESSKSGNAGKTRRVFRDEDNKVLGGVCSGIGAYFDIDPLWIRLGLIALLFGFGSGLLLYIILWIIIPAAKTTTEKLEMKGEKVDVNSISQSIREEAKNLKGRIDNFNSGKVTGFLQQVFGKAFAVFLRLIGFVLTVCGIGFFIFVLCILFGIGTIDHLRTGEFFNSVFGNSVSVFALKVGIILAFLIPTCMMVYKGMKLLLGIKFHNRWINISALVFCITGLIIVSFQGVNLLSEFSESGQQQQVFPIKMVKEDTLIIRASSNACPTFQSSDFHKKRKIRINGRRWIFKGVTEDGKWIASPGMEIRSSGNDSIYLSVVKSSRGSDNGQAVQTAKKIMWNWQQQDSVIILDPCYFFLSKDKFRCQNVRILLKIPKGRIFFIDASMAHLLDDVENLQGMNGEEMVGKYWVMTDNGLNCLSGTSIHSSEGGDILKIDSNGIEVNSEDAHVKISREGIHIEEKKARK